jgi:hypothetical protein
MRRDENAPKIQSVDTSNPMLPAAAVGGDVSVPPPERSNGDEDKVNPLSRNVLQISFLWRSYTPEYWWVQAGGWVYILIE